MTRGGHHQPSRSERPLAHGDADDQDVRREASTVKTVSCLQDGRYGRPWNCGSTYVSG